MKLLYSLSPIMVAFCLFGCGKEVVSAHSADWYSANPKERDADSAACHTNPPRSDVGKQNCRNAEASELRDMTGPSHVQFR